MPGRKRHNWKARQTKESTPQKHLGLRDVIEDAGSPGVQRDTNYLVLPSKRDTESMASRKDTKEKRPKLAKKQKKRLKKIVQAKEKAAKRRELLEKLQHLQVPLEEQSLLQSTTALGQKKAIKTVESLNSFKNVSPITLSTPRRKRRRKQKPRFEKKLTEPSLCVLSSDGESVSSEDPEDSMEASTMVGSVTGGNYVDQIHRSGEKVLGASEAVVGGPSPHPSQQNTIHIPSTVGKSPLHEQSESSLMQDDSGSEGPKSDGKSWSVSDVQVSQSKSQVPQDVSNSPSGSKLQVPQDASNSPSGSKLQVPQDASNSRSHQSGADLQTEAAVCSKVREAAVFVPVHRDSSVQATRLELPILAEEQVIMETIHENSVTVLCGETGSGKTTQIPQFLYEAGYTRKYGGSMIGVTQPRRVAAISMSKRVAQEMNLSNRIISYQIRYEGNVTDETEIKFMTDGVLLKEIERDFLLTNYSVIMIDEAHERSVFTDILIGLLSRIAPLREKNGRPLKMIISSATLRVEDFTENRSLFPTTPPVVKVESRQFPVTVHFNKRTPVDYITEAYRKVCKIHRELKAGNILVFVTGQKEVNDLCRKLACTFPSSVAPREDGERESGVEGEAVLKRKRKKEQDIDLDKFSIIPHENISEDDGENGGGGDIGDGYHMQEETDSDSDLFGEGYHDIEDDISSANIGPSECDKDLPLLVLPLYSMLSSERQSMVFRPPPEGVRLCVVATNVAETSLTIPDMKYVVDTGKVKSRHYDSVTGISAFRIEWTSKASANQRAGRAGRTEPGHCYRLYSSAVFENDFELFSTAEILRRPVDDLLLQMKAMNIDRVVNFPFPTSPDKEAMQSAEQKLINLDSLSVEKTASGGRLSRITSLGRTMARIPVAPHFAKMLCLSRQHGCLPYMIAIVAGLSVKEIFLESDISLLSSEDDERKVRLSKMAAVRRTWAGQGESLLLGDLMVILKAIGCVEYAGLTEGGCRSHGLRHKAMIEIRKLRTQLTNSVNSVCSDVDVCVDPKMEPPSNQQLLFLRQIVLSGLGDHVARKVPTGQLSSEEQKRLKYAYQCVLCEEPVYMHPASVLVKHLPEFIVFQEILETSKKYMRGITAIEREWLPLLLPKRCTFSKPLASSPPFIDPESGVLMCHMTSNYGPRAWPIPAQDLPYPEGLEKYKVFGKFLMEGEVFKDLKQFSSTLLCTPVAMIKTWGTLHRCTEVLLTALANKEVTTKKKLKEIWKEDPKYLLKAVSLWLPQSKHRTLAQIWPPKE